MWLLQGLERDIKFLLFPTNETTPLLVGRIPACRLLLKGDLCVSRNHARIHVQPPKSWNNPKDHGIVQVEVLNTKHGTSVNSTMLVAGNTHDLHDGDVIKFGATLLRATYVPVVVCCSNVMKDVGYQVSEACRRIGGHFVKQWSSDCTHLVMKTVQVTEKVILALVQGRHLVTPDWIISLESEGRMTPEERFMPHLMDQYVNGKVDLGVDPKRSSLFKHVKFVHLSLKPKFTEIIQACGGTFEAFDPQRMTSLCKDPSVCLLDDKSCPYRPRIYELLHRNGRRLISISEIPQAILHVCTSSYCNPLAAAPVVQRGMSQAMGINSQLPDSQSLKSQTFSASLPNKTAIVPSRLGKGPLALIERERASTETLKTSKRLDTETVQGVRGDMEQVEPPFKIARKDSQRVISKDDNPKPIMKVLSSDHAVPVHILVAHDNSTRGQVQNDHNDHELNASNLFPSHDTPILSDRPIGTANVYPCESEDKAIAGLTPRLSHTNSAVSATRTLNASTTVAELRKEKPFMAREGLKEKELLKGATSQHIDIVVTAHDSVLKDLLDDPVPSIDISKKPVRGSDSFVPESEQNEPAHEWFAPTHILKDNNSNLHNIRITKDEDSRDVNQGLSELLEDNDHHNDNEASSVPSQPRSRNTNTWWATYESVEPPPMGSKDVQITFMDPPVQANQREGTNMGLPYKALNGDNDAPMVDGNVIVERIPLVVNNPLQRKPCSGIKRPIPAGLINYKVFKKIQHKVVYSTAKIIGNDGLQLHGGMEVRDNM
eukprot:Ihof_evm7s155 gene=Ihof_evmTU7s155